MMKNLLTLAAIALFAVNVTAQDCGGCDNKAKTDSCNNVCSTAKPAAAKSGDCGSCAQDTKAVVVKVQEEKTAKKGSGCDKLDAYLALEKGCANGCETSKAKMAALVKANPKLPEIATTYKKACNGCETSKAKLASMRKSAEAKTVKTAKTGCDAAACETAKVSTAKKDSCCGSTAKVVAAKKDSCCGSTAKVVAAKKDSCCGTSASKVAKVAKTGDCSGASCDSSSKVAKTVKGSGCDKLDSYLALEKGSAKGCETSKAKLAALVKANPNLPEIATTYKKACNGCSASKAKLASMQKAAAATSKTPAKPVTAVKRGDCGGKCGSGCDKLDSYLALEKGCASGCETSKTKMAALVKDNPKLPEIAKLYKNACNGCESSKAKLAAMKKDAAAPKKAAKTECCPGTEGKKECGESGNKL